MPTVRVTAPIDTLVEYGQPFRAEVGDILDGDLAVKALAQGWPVETDKADPPAHKPTPVAKPDDDPPPPDKTATAKRTYRKPAKKAAPRKTAAKKAAPPAARK